MLEYAKLTIELLQNINPTLWAETFVNRKMEFHRLYGRGLITSTVHGIDFFDNVVGCIEGRMKWTEQGEYGNNFRKMIELVSK